MRFLTILLLLAGIANAGEYVLFASGGRMRVDGHEAVGSKIRLRTGQGSAEVDAAQVLAFETEEYVAAAPAPAPVMAAAPAPPAPTPHELADRAADKCGLPRQWVRSIMAAESGFNPQAVSPKGAIGLMQLMPDTARTLGVDPHDPAQNAEAGACYLRDLLVRYNGQLWHALAAYNAGPGAVDKYGNVPPYPETIGYINRIALDHQKKSASPDAAAPR
jgi:soluble lytic murein transglycosylase-like protein